MNEMSDVALVTIALAFVLGVPGIIATALLIWANTLPDDE